ncbi:VOC family protein [Jeotgalibacillus sp. R-1-5s-1]|uniref:VOC family protein n=1 Tax=Jeotgalibacillus sp. R-1-5s-1 TaxID=2555897 RepID=UPI001069A376|nr:VOC family protein [Jeotgalibacillus sp. R-1-5s-1]TFE00096.1 glyoxalase [Jeotgalibacillus sp. R-1-5s-1]
MTYSFKQIDHIQLAAPVDSEETARDFFHGVLGLPEIEKPDSLKANGGVWFACGHHQLHIGIEKDFAPAKKAHPAFEIEQIENLQAHLEEQGYPVITDDRLPGAIRFYVDDPFGNRLEFLEWENGR